MTKQLHFEIPDKTHDYLRKEAYKRKVTMSTIVRELIDREQYRPKAEKMIKKILEE